MSPAAPSPPSRTTARVVTLASPHAAATEVGAESARRGGNALDAAIAAAVTLTVAYPHNTSLGGDLFALVRAPDGRISSVNASGPAAGRVDVGAVSSRHAGRMPVRGIDTVTVPGAVAGLGALHALGARLPWGAHLEAAIELAAHGVAVSPGLARAIDEDLDLVRADAGLAAVFAPGGRPLRHGNALVQPELARTLGILADDGPAAFYRGPLAERIVGSLRAHGSALEGPDFSGFEPRRDEHIARTFRGHEVVTAGPNSQGFVLLEILQALELLDCRDPLGEDAGLLSAIFAMAADDRDRHLADPCAMTEPVDDLLDPGRWSSLLASLLSPLLSPLGETLGAASPAASSGRAGRPAGGRPLGDTVAVVAADSDGWAVSLIQSLFHSFGSGVLDPASGVIFHDRGAMFSLEAGSPNVLAPGKRPAHTLMPVLVTREGSLRWVTGTMGGFAQPQIHAQLLLRLFDGADPAAAVGGARWIVAGDASGASALVEPGVAPLAKESIGARMAARDLGELDETVGHAHAIALDGAGGAGGAGGADGDGWRAGSDPRSDGAAAIVRVPPGTAPPDTSTAATRPPGTGTGEGRPAQGGRH